MGIRWDMSISLLKVGPNWIITAWALADQIDWLYSNGDRGSQSVFS